MLYPYNGILLSIEKEPQVHAVTEMNLKNMPSERSQTQKSKHCMTYSFKILEKAEKSMKGRSVVA